MASLLLFARFGFAAGFTLPLRQGLRGGRLDCEKNYLTADFADFAD